PDGRPLESQPLRVVLGESDIPSDASVLDDRAETLQIRTRSLSKALSQLWSLGIKHVFVEGGPKVASAFIANGLVDEFLIYLAPKLLGGPKLAVTDIGIDDISEVMNLKVIEQKQLGDDIFIRARRA
ncbi:MAG: dihydrofolate reductase family protein, partial [Aquiluna sp.]